MNDPVKSKGNPGFAFLCSHPFHLVSLGFGSGLSPVMPGTTGTLFAWIVYDILTFLWPTIFTPFVWGCICIAGFLFGIKTCQATGDALGSPDDGSIKYSLDSTAAAKAKKSYERTKEIVAAGLTECQQAIGCEITFK